MARVWILAALVVTGFAILMLLAGRGDAFDSRALPPWTITLGRFFVHRAPVQAGELFGGCESNRTVTAPLGASCRVSVAASSRIVRQLKVVLVAGARADVRVTPRGDEGTPIRVPLRQQAPESPDLVILPDGAWVDMTCLAAPPPQPCLLRIE